MWSRFQFCWIPKTTLCQARKINGSQVRFEKLTCRDALNQALDEELARDKTVILLGEDVGLFDGAFKVSKGLVTKHGAHRILDTPITEAGFAGLAVGAAFSGLRPICEFMSFNFSMQAIDHLVNSAAKTFYMSAGQLQCPVTFRGPNGIGSGIGAQHSQCLASWYAHVPGMKVVAPFSAEDCRGLLKSAIRDNDPVIVLEHELLYGVGFDISPSAMSPDFLLPIGKAKVEVAGSDLTLVSYSRGVAICLQAAESLHQGGVASCEVINLRSLRPLDTECIFTSIKKTHRLIIVEEGWHTCGIGSAVSGLVCEGPVFFELDAPVLRLSGVDTPMPYAASLEKLSIPCAQDVVNAVKRMLNK